MDVKFGIDTVEFLIVHVPLLSEPNVKVDASVNRLHVVTNENKVTDIII